MLIFRTLDAYVRRYSDTKETVAYVEFLDRDGNWERMHGRPDNPIIAGLLERAEREGLTIRQEQW